MHGMATLLPAAGRTHSRSHAWAWQPLREVAYSSVVLKRAPAPPLPRACGAFVGFMRAAAEAAHTREAEAAACAANRTFWCPRSSEPESEPPAAADTGA